MIAIFLFETSWKSTQRFRIKNEELDACFPAFRRHDGLEWRRWRFYLQIFTGVGFFRVILGFPFFLTTCFYATFCLLGHDRSKPITGMRDRILWYGQWFWAQTILSLIVWLRTKHVRHDDYDYSYYLGPDYKKTQKLPKKVSTLVMNHQSWIDNLVAVTLYRPAFLIKAEIKKVPLVNECLAGLEVFYVERQATKEQREAAI